MTYYIVTFEVSRNGVAWELDPEAQTFLTEADAIECAEEWADGGRGTRGMVRTLGVVRVNDYPAERGVAVEPVYWRPMVDELRADRECEARHEAGLATYMQGRT